MIDITNPYRPGEAVDDPAMLFGRREASDWIELQINSNHQTLILSASPLIGKTSFIKQIGALQTISAVNLTLALSQLSGTATRQMGRKRQSNNSLNTVLQSVIQQLEPQLKLLGLGEVIQETASLPVSAALRELFNRTHQTLQPNQKLLLFVDDLHLLVTDDMALIASFLTSLMPLLDECSQLYLIFTINQETLKRLRHPLIDGAPTFHLGPLSLDASINMVTAPVKDVLRFDYGVTKRIAEVNSHHPYYLSLFCHTLLNRQVQDGWVNQRDFDATLSQILNSPIEPFTKIWEASNWVERAVLSGMAFIQGAHGPITGQEIIRALQRQTKAVAPDVVMHALQTLTERSVLIPMGAVSYRFHVELFRFWLREHTNLSEILGQVNWAREATQLKALVEANKPAAAGPAIRHPAPASTPARPKRRLLLPTVLSGIILCALAAAGTAFAAQYMGLPIAFLSPPTPTATPTATPNSEDIAPLTGSEGETPQPAEPTPTATPTAPLVVARTLPSIAYMARDVDQNWHIYLMNNDGSEVTLISPEGGDDTSPVWSPDAKKIAFVSRRDGNREIYIIDSNGQNMVNVTRHPADDWTPAWSPDGSRLAFSSIRDGSWEIFVMDTACFDQPETCPDSLTQITNDDNGNLSPVYSPDGTRFAFNSKANANWDIYTMAVDGSDIQQVTTAPQNDLAPAWSPDGTQIAFESNRDGNVEIYVVDANGGVAQNITNLPLADDHGPTWDPSGQQIVFYSNREGNWDIFVTTLDGQTVTNLTQSPARDEQTPAWRP